MLVIITLLLLAAYLVFAGRCRAMFECIILYDTAKLWFGERYSRKAFIEAKDRNNDGKTTYWERTFPNDGGHRAKLAEVLYLALAAAMGVGVVIKAFLYVAYGENNFWQEVLANLFYWPWPILIGLGTFLIYSGSFGYFHKKYRKPPPPTLDEILDQHFED